MLAVELRNFFKFDESDLTENRAGKISSKQLDALITEEKKVKRFYARLAVVLVLGYLALAYAILKSAVPAPLTLEHIFSLKSSDLTQLLIGIGVPGLIFGIFVAIFVGVVRVKGQYVLDKVEGEVNFVKVEKTTRTKSASGSSYTRTFQVYELRVGKVKFHDVKEELLNVMREGDVYGIYYLKDTSNILSVEFISKGK